MNLKSLIIFLCVLPVAVATAQNPVKISLSNTTLVATDSVMPFWLTANRHGKIKSEASFLNITEIAAVQDYRSGKKWQYTWGGDVLAAFGETNYYLLNRAFAGIAFKGWEIKGGLFYDETKYAGLSTTNGNLAKSENARPVPRVRFATTGYKPVPLMQKSLSFKAEYEEGFLNDNRYVDGAHLHHKSLYLKIHPCESWNIQMGFEHFVMWGGKSRNDKIGQMPEGWNAYWHYVLALPGGEDFPVNDQLNNSGNQLGTWQFEMTKHFNGVSATFYLSHPWEDNSGLNWRNWPDNLLGLHIHISNEKKWITGIVYEFTNTRQQSIKDSLYTWDETTGKWRRGEPDSYYNHGIYRSGYTYHQQVMSSPLFFPVTVNDDISMGIRSNRFISHHIGARGHFSEHISWKGMLTHIRHLGTWSQPYSPEQNQFSGLLEAVYASPGFPVEIGLAMAADSGSVTGKNLGFQFTLAKRW